MIELICRHCAVTFAADPNRRGPKRKYCSPKCGVAAWHVAHGRTRDVSVRACIHCAAEFTGRNKSAYCGTRCWRLANYKSRSKGFPGSVRHHKDDLIAMYKSGATLQQIGDKYHVTREWIRQIISKHGITRTDSGRHQEVLQKEARRQDRMNQRMLDKYGMSRAAYLALNDVTKYESYWRTPIAGYLMQRRNARERGIAFNLTFAQWWNIWEESGKWGERGRNADSACMSRVGDSGIYEVGNVYISTMRENAHEGRMKALEHPRPRTPLSAVIHAAGGPTAVSAVLGAKANYISIRMVYGHLPKSWITDGRIQKLAELTAGAYSAEKIIELAVAA